MPAPHSVPPLALVMPHPSLPRRRSSMLSQTTPRTPSCGSPIYTAVFLPSSSNRKSSDSWTSSNFDMADDELQAEWTPEQTRLLSRTMDALPAHILTPFNGPVPPSNLLDKIARGVSQVKGPNDWPHCLRATRAKLIELCRARAQDVAEEKRRNTIEEEDLPYEGGVPLRQTTNIGTRRLYRQSSMDFMQSARLSADRNSDPFSRVSNHLERTDRVFPNPAYHPYSRPPSSKGRPNSNGIYSHGPSTPSSTTLHSSRSSMSLSRRSTSSTLSSSSDMHTLPVFGPNARKTRRTDSFGASRQPLKRAPSFTTDSTCSDEDSKACTRSAKKVRRQAPLTPDSIEERKPKKHNGCAPPAGARATLKRNPSMFGPELPPIPAQAQPEQPFLRVQIPALQPQTPCPCTPPRTIRRVRPLRAARRISFSSAPMAPLEANEPVEIISGSGLGLGDAFQLR
ncbi:hypothetical protein EWM64_g5957 [Hericium alpestre]|uniref:Uncharacterized protein n=1 Tax=Hericium alpestre TaxID=135208 RepID=A0A4Y9ZTZ6_9AGAM|nr:hypothetical protein EWM64_g5957 [Hericium alpestre]